MKDNKMKKIGIISAAVVGALAIVWFLIVYPLIDFSTKEKELMNAAKDYYEKNSELLPTEGTTVKVSMEKLLDQKYLKPIKTTYGSKNCSGENSWVKVTKELGEYKYYTYLECGNMKSSIDHEGPTIKLNGDEEITIEKNSKFTDPGIKSVYDDTDGKLDTKVVKVEGEVNTKKIGTYTIKYSATDSLNNKNVVKRKVTVIQTLDKLVKSEVGTEKVYKEDRFIMFSNSLFRIVGLNADGTVKIESYGALGTVNYEDLNDWLNDYYYEHIVDEYKDYVVKQEYCSSKVNEKEYGTVNNKCDSKNKQYVGVLSVSEYNKSQNINPNNITWTSDYTGDKEAIATSTNFGGQETYYMSFDKKYNFAVRPVVSLKTGIKIKKGDGSYNNPYQFVTTKKGKVGDKINTRETGEYVEYKQTVYRIIDTDDDGNTKVISEGTVGNRIKYEDTDTVKKYNPNKKGNIGYIINNTASKYIKTDIFVKKEIAVSIYDKTPTYSGKKTEKKYEVKLAAPDMYELYSGAYEDSGTTYWLRTSSNTKGNMYIVSPINVIYYNELEDSTYAGMRVVGYINKSATILSGKGTKYDPYVLTK